MFYNRPNLTESEPKLNSGFIFLVYSGVTPGLLEWTLSKLRSEVYRYMCIRNIQEAGIPDSKMVR